MSFLKKPTFAKQEVGFISGFSKVGFVENYGLSHNDYNNLVTLPKTDAICHPARQIQSAPLFRYYYQSIICPKNRAVGMLRLRT